jgi:hypothetical protein
MTNDKSILSLERQKFEGPKFYRYASVIPKLTVINIIKQKSAAVCYSYIALIAKILSRRNTVPLNINHIYIYVNATLFLVG